MAGSSLSSPVTFSNQSDVDSYNKGYQIGLYGGSYTAPNSTFLAGLQAGKAQLGMAQKQGVEVSYNSNPNYAQRTFSQSVQAGNASYLPPPQASSQPSPSPSNIGGGIASGPNQNYNPVTPNFYSVKQGPIYVSAPAQQPIQKSFLESWRQDPLGIGLARNVVNTGFSKVDTFISNQAKANPNNQILQFANQKASFSPFDLFFTTAVGTYPGLAPDTTRLNVNPTSREVGTINIKPTGETAQTGGRSYDIYTATGESKIVTPGIGKNYVQENIFDVKVGVSNVNDQLSTVIGSKNTLSNLAGNIEQVPTATGFKAYQYTTDRYTLSIGQGVSDSGVKTFSFGSAKDLISQDNVAIFGGHSYIKGGGDVLSLFKVNTFPADVGVESLGGLGGGSSGGLQFAQKSNLVNQQVSSAVGNIVQGQTLPVVQSISQFPTAIGLGSANALKSITSTTEQTSQKVQLKSFQDQGLISQLKTYQNQFSQFKTIQQSKTVQVQTPKTNQIVSPIQTPATITVPITTPIVTPIVTPITTPITTPIAPTFGFPPVTPTTGIIIPPIALPPISLGGDVFNFSQTRKRKLKRTPSLYASLEGITARKGSKLDITGLSTRAIITGGKRRR